MLFEKEISQTLVPLSTRKPSPALTLIEKILDQPKQYLPHPHPLVTSLSNDCPLKQCTVYTSLVVVSPGDNPEDYLCYVSGLITVSSH